MITLAVTGIQESTWKTGRVGGGGAGSLFDTDGTTASNGSPGVTVDEEGTHNGDCPRVTRDVEMAEYEQTVLELSAWMTLYLKGSKICSCGWKGDLITRLGV